MSGGPRIMLSVGEASGDLHGAGLCRELRRLAPAARLAGMGGPRMAAAGMDVIVDPTRHATIGTSEAVGRLPALYRAYRRLVDRIEAEPPQALVLIDFPEFNLRLARRAHRAGVPVIYFIPPQVWAWRRGRLRLIRRVVRRVLTVLPFEHALYAEAGVAAQFVGHPLLDSVPLTLDRDEARRRLGLPPAARVVGLLPGSRRQEVTRLLPGMLDAVRALARRHPGLRAVLALAPSIERAGVEAQVAARAPEASVTVVEGATHEVMAAADALLIASGTATLEAALLGAPMAVCYRVSRATELMTRALIRVPWISLPNLIAGREIVPEILQGAVTGWRLADEAAALLAGDGPAARQRAAFAELRGRLGEPGVAARAARAVLEIAQAA